VLSGKRDNAFTAGAPQPILNGTYSMIDSVRFIPRSGGVLALLLVASALVLIPFQGAQATTAFARQTGEPCVACHMQGYGPWLTQYGMKFKLDGYVAGHANKLPDALNPFALEVVASVTNTQQDVPGGQYYSTRNNTQSWANNNVVNDWTALYYTGRVWDKVGSYLQLNFNPQVGRSISLAMADIRFADHTTLFGNNVTYGVTVNNAPTMSDFWMTTYAWMYPYTTSSVTVKPVAQPYLQALMAGANTAGSTVYTMINNHLYLEAGGYTSQAQNMAQGLGVWNGGSLSQGPQSGLINGGAPYWRMFLQHSTGPHTMMVGTYGLQANVSPLYNQSNGTNSYVEYNVDANYSFMMDDDNMFMAMFRYTRDNMGMAASQAAGYSANSSNYLNNVMLMGMWTYQQTYNLTFGWNNQTGSADSMLYNGNGSGTVNAITGSANGSPNTNSFLVELDYIPFGKGGFVTDPYVNLRLSLQYWAYTQFNGGYNNYDGYGRSPEANNTLYFVGNLMF
jgi:hypothetical protein